MVDAKTYQKTFAGQIVREARTYTGTPYRSGGNTRTGIDCSGLIANVFSSVGLKMPRVSWQQSEVGYEVEVNAIRPGDLLFFVPDKGKSGYVSHAAIVTEVRNYDSDIRFIHASSSRGVREDNLYSTYFKGRFVKALRPF
ncbi:MAG: NlpC/P60 family protein [Cytophagales bacterium]|nr:MAG: NlpC/P60 family protein [Cytophagales bacterium]